MLGSEAHSYSPVLNASSGAGYVTPIGGLNCYVTGSNFTLCTILLVADIFGINATNFRNLADKVAARGYYVVAPDLFNGNPFDPDDVNRPLSVWLQDHPPENASADVKPVLQELRSKGYSRPGVAGFCWGGKAMSDLGKTNYVKAASQSHPSFLEADDVRGIKVPFQILGGQNDTMTPPSRIREAEQVLRNAKPKVPYQVKIFPNVEHGWTLLYDPNDPVAVKAADKAHRTMIAWFDKYVRN